ncbi:autotransporter assembly complex protein TamA [Sphingomonas jatrophae]|uniref:Autotransporter secretion outer membrane protein TamA n=1 Tax=Sphingomonas jatrophae TaxID=1166337 RepID=A0A1I6JQ14_9SPHN|nr:BamA/TamA family outer membrane protein [Sphingomonas jatrophae]SFR81047.1 autotransporter secretion outer membrane protein TamA [Sphingomonas jatrophae]
MGVFDGRLGSALVAAVALVPLTSAAAFRAQLEQPAAAEVDPFDDPVFQQSLPPLDATAPVAPAPLPATPPVDPALAEPLPPLATFDATPPATPAQSAGAGETPKIPYRTEVTGLKDIGLDDEYRALSALAKDKRADNAAQVGARADEDVKLIGRLLRSQGYYDGVATAKIAPIDQEGVIRVTLTATPGARYSLGKIAITGAEPEPTKLAYDALALSEGAPIVAAEIEGAEARVALRLPEQGFPFAEVGERDILLDDATHRGDYTLPLTSGPKARFGGLRTEGDPVFGLDHLAIFPRFKAGDLYDSRQTDDLRQALIGTSLFSTIAVEPVRTGTLNPDGTEQVDLLVRQTKGPWRSLAASAGYGTGEGATVTGSWTHRNLFPPEGALTVAATAGTLQQNVSVLFRRSNAGQRDRSFTAGASVARQRFAAYDAETVQLNAALARQSTPIWQKRWTWSVGTELVATREDRFATATQARNNSTYFIVAVPAQLGFDSSDSLLDPTRGFRVTGRISPEAQKRSGGGFDGYARLLLEGSTYYPVMDNLVIAGRARVGSIMGASRDSIAPSRRLYAGGGGSVRGFGFQELGPKDINDDPIGGRSLTEFALEARYRFGNYGIVPFIDAGRVGEGSTPSISDMRYGVGIGGRYYTNFGPLRVDVAMPIDRQPGESKIALYLSIGQAF